MGRFDGKVAIVTGAGRGIGRSHALLLASEGAAVVVNDRGGSSGGDGADSRPAQEVVDELGGLEVLITQAGILRDKMSFNMDEAAWDSVIDVHLKGHFAPSKFAAAYWRARTKETGEQNNAKI